MKKLRFSLRDLIWFVLFSAAFLGFMIERHKRLADEQKIGITLYDKNGQIYAKFPNITDIDMGQISLDPDVDQISKIQVIITDE